MSEERPKWPFKEMTEADFRKIYEFGSIIAVAAKYKMTGPDTADEWIEATRYDGKSMRMPRTWGGAFMFVGYWSNPGLFRLTYTGERMRDTLLEIDKWEKRNDRDRREYERLKKKFEEQPVSADGEEKL